MTDVTPRPIKRLGQNWLRDPYVIEKLVAAAELKPTDTVVEIGPGMGAITRLLAKQAGQVLAYEIDPTLVDKLREELHWAKNIEIINKNILAHDFKLPKQTYKVVASLPYYITSPILEILLTAQPIASTIVLMVQREVAEKITAPAPDGSYLSNFTRLFGEPEIISLVGPAAFFPRPQVDSAILRIRTLPIPQVGPEEVAQMMTFLHAGFSDPRKQIHNSLSNGLHLSSQQTKTILQIANIAAERRPETLTTQEWLKLYDVVKKA